MVGQCGQHSQVVCTGFDQWIGIQIWIKRAQLYSHFEKFLTSVFGGSLYGGELGLCWGIFLVRLLQQLRTPG